MKEISKNANIAEEKNLLRVGLPLMAEHTFQLVDFTGLLFM